MVIRLYIVKYAFYEGKRDIPPFCIMFKLCVGFHGIGSRYSGQSMCVIHDPGWGRLRLEGRKKGANPSLRKISAVFMKMYFVVFNS